MVTCPRCDSQDVERLTTPFGLIPFVSFGIAGLCLFVGVFFWPLLICFVLFSIIGFISGGAWVLGTFYKMASLFSKKGRERLRENKWRWQCKKCKNVFIYILEDAPQISLADNKILQRSLARKPELAKKMLERNPQKRDEIIKLINKVTEEHPELQGKFNI